MMPYRLFIGALCLVGLLSGCATHYYRVHENHATLYLRLAQAEEVVLFASSDGFAPHAAERMSGKWVNTLPNTLPMTSEFHYFYKVDGELFIPDCRYKEKDDFGQENCVFLPGR